MDKTLRHEIDADLRVQPILILRNPHSKLSQIKRCKGLYHASMNPEAQATRLFDLTVLATEKLVAVESESKYLLRHLPATYDLQPRQLSLKACCRYHFWLEFRSGGLRQVKSVSISRFSPCVVAALPMRLGCTCWIARLVLDRSPMLPKPQTLLSLLTQEYTCGSKQYSWLTYRQAILERMAVEVGSRGLRWLRL